MPNAKTIKPPKKRAKNRGTQKSKIQKLFDSGIRNRCARHSHRLASEKKMPHQSKGIPRRGFKWASSASWTACRVISYTFFISTLCIQKILCVFFPGMYILAVIILAFLNQNYAML